VAHDTSQRLRTRGARRLNTECPRESEQALQGNVANPRSRRRSKQGSGQAEQPRRTEVVGGSEDVAGSDEQGSRRRVSQIMQERGRQRIAGQGCGERDRVWEPEPPVGGTPYGLPSWLYRHCGRGLSYEESKRSIETLSGMWCSYVSETLWEEIGGLDRIQQAAFLFSLMREYEKGTNEARVFLEGKKTPKGFLRELRGKAAATSAPHRSSDKKQPGGEHTDPVQVVSQLSPCNSETDWQRGGWEDGIPRTSSGVPSRVDRLKGLGNSVVPQVVEQIGRAIMAADGA